MDTYLPPHDAHDADKVESLIESIRMCEYITPIVVMDEIAITGSHRIEAYQCAHALWSTIDGWSTDMPETGPVIAAVEISTEDAENACKAHQVDDLIELYNCVGFDGVCEALYNVIDDQELLDALEDQRGF